MDELIEDLWAAFCQDCHERMRLIADIIQSDIPLSCTQLDQLHQEYDTLHGGARVLDLADLEQYFRIMASYARYLRNREMSSRKTEGYEWEMLKTGVELVRLCNGSSDCCLKHCSIERVNLLLELEKLSKMETQNENSNS